MNVELILFRHGKAESQNVALEDQDRPLTEEGKKELECNIKELSTFIRKDQEIHLWSSPLLRAAQTAQILADGLGVCNVLHFEFIANGDDLDFEIELGNLNLDTTVIVVGHEPGLSNWGRKICGCQVPFRKGTAACFSINALSPLSGALEWIIQPKAFFPDKDKTLKSEYKKILIYHLSELVKMKKLFLFDPAEAETAHQVRVRIRQFRSLISVIKPLMNIDDYEKIQDQLRFLANRFAYIRLIDVLIEEWDSLIKNHPELSKDPLAFPSVMSKERLRDQSDLISELKNESSQNESSSQKESSSQNEFTPPFESWDSAINNIWLWILGPRWEDNLKTEISYGDFITDRLDRWSRKSRKELNKLTFDDFDATHRLRIRLKKLRYAMAILGPSVDRGNGKLLSDLKLLQDKIGKICDARKNAAFMESLLAKYHKTLFQYESGLLIGYLINGADQISRQLAVEKMRRKL